MVLCQAFYINLSLISLSSFYLNLRDNTESFIQEVILLFLTTFLLVVSKHLPLHFHGQILFIYLFARQFILFLPVHSFTHKNISHWQICFYLPLIQIESLTVYLIILLNQIVSG